MGLWQDWLGSFGTSKVKVRDHQSLPVLKVDWCTLKVPCTVPVLRMAHRKWKETKQQPGTAEPGSMLGCCF